MNEFNQQVLQQLYKPSKDSHKGQNGKLILVSGSHLFHAASLWALTIASRIVDMVFYSSVDENNDIVQKAKEEFRNGIVVPRNRLDSYIQESDCILIGPGLPRKDGEEEGDDNTKELTENLLKKYPQKQWVIDGGSLQVMDPSLLPHHAILTPHKQEFEKLFKIPPTKESVEEMAKKYQVIILLKGQEDIVCSAEECVLVHGGNIGMTKGGTGDVLAGLVAALACKNDPFLAAIAGSFFNKKAADVLEETQGIYFNASDLTVALPHIMKEYLHGKE